MGTGLAQGFELTIAGRVKPGAHCTDIGLAAVRPEYLDCITRDTIARLVEK